ncbi:MAG TPA: 3-phosphoshikimate 1-carboxyvinyltransferase [Cytophagaceae bacterium]|jgi:3-phosphoshikimate 1-carboxyvinyltransferase|nr:3-phosphoshikimate 1-carboxyvinyltransferase [Cytophagaceae bacterium]
MQESLTIKKHPGKVHCSVTPPSSKSESNRVLIIDALAGFQSDLQNLSNARDTQTMIRLLDSSDKVLDVIDAGTTMRFLTAYLAFKGETHVLTGTKRMCERPIKLLVDALKTLGAGIGYLDREGYPPIEIEEFEKGRVLTNKLKIKGDVSSQYITALLMIAPSLPQGLALELEGKIGSKPYIEMTLTLMKQFGVSSEWKDNIIKIIPQKYIPTSYKVESDWSAASYWYSIAALSADANIEILGYNKESLQGDSIIAKIMEKLGVSSTFTSTGILLQKTRTEKSIELDFTHCPDLAQTIAVICAAKGIECTMTGLESLRIKETDRIAALQNELRKFGSDLIETIPNSQFTIRKSPFTVSGQTVSTYKDHRMAMAFAPLALLGDITIENPEVVEKSYPHYWEDLKVAGFDLDL